MLFRIASILFSMLFLLSVVVQWNDPDPLLWMTAYGSACGLSLGACFGRTWPAPTALAVLGYAVATARMAPAFGQTSLAAFRSVGMDSIEQEEVREAWGLVLCLAWTTILLVRSLYVRRKEPDRLDI